MSDCGIRSREEQRLVPAVSPPHDERWPPVLTMDLDDLAVAVGFSGPMAVHHDLISYLCLHGPSFPPSVDRHPRPGKEPKVPHGDLAWRLGTKASGHLGGANVR
jgi:hypothetical protein